jgi:hypothetical protein
MKSKEERRRKVQRKSREKGEERGREREERKTRKRNFSLFFPRYEARLPSFPPGLIPS